MCRRKIKTNKFHWWVTTECEECEECGEEFQVSRTEPVELECPILCNDCEIRKEAYLEGFEAGVASVTLNEDQVCGD